MQLKNRSLAVISDIVVPSPRALLGRPTLEEERSLVPP